MLGGIKMFDHVAFQVKNIGTSIEYYSAKYDDVEIVYKDETWAMIQISNVRIALVLGDSHPPHIAITQKCPVHPDAKRHRDNSYYIYDEDPDGNVIERLWWPDVNR
jgi:predicted lactoylglutathione lyase